MCTIIYQMTKEYPQLVYSLGLLYLDKYLYVFECPVDVLDPVPKLGKNSLFDNCDLVWRMCRVQLQTI